MPSNGRRICVDDYVLDVHQGADRAYYAVTTTGSNEIVAIGDEATIELAERSGRWTISNLAAQQDANASATSLEAATS